MTDAPQFVFEMIYTDWDTDPYYHRDWYGAKSIDVVAPNKDEAIAKAKLALGEAPRSRRWAFKIKSVRDILIPTPTKEKP